MSKIPFEKFIITFLILNKDLEYIVGTLKEFHYHITPDEITEIFDSIRKILPQKIKERIENGFVFKLDNEEEVQWLKHFEIYEFYDFLIRKDKLDIEPPPYFKWIRDILWAHKHMDIMALINILIFNQEDLESISNIVQFKYKKKIAKEALAWHMRMLWDCRLISAKEALYHCIPFRKNAMIVRNIRSSGEAVISQLESNDGSDVPFTFHDSGYIKWKIGYEVKVPNIRTFLDKVKTDSYFKYYEAMNMVQSVEIEEEMGSNEKLGAFDSTKTKRRNVEEHKARAAKHWMDLFVKADKSMPVEGADDKDFFQKMDQVELGFDEEKLVQITENPEILKDIKGDM